MKDLIDRIQANIDNKTEPTEDDLEQLLWIARYWRAISKEIDEANKQLEL